MPSTSEEGDTASARLAAEDFRHLQEQLPAMNEIQTTDANAVTRANSCESISSFLREGQSRCEGSRDANLTIEEKVGTGRSQGKDG